MFFTLFKYSLVMIVVAFLYFIFSNHLKIDFKSFFRRGFKKIDNDFGLYCYTGKQGKGKTYTCINFLINYTIHNPDVLILSNIKSFKTFENIKYFEDINELIDYCVAHYQDEKIIILFDEIFTILEKRTAINKKILSFISQLRKRQIIFLTTAQEWAEVNITFRRYVRFQIDCNMFSLPLTHTAFLLYRVNDGDQIKWDEQEMDFVAPTLETYFGKAKKSVVEQYDTFETISTNR